MMDFEDMLLDAMGHGMSLEDVMKGISTAATKIEKDQAAASKYDQFDKPVYESFEDGGCAADAIVYADKITTYAAAVVIAHFMCQNVPGYAKALAKNDTDPVELYRKMLESQVRSAKVITEHQDDTDEDKGKALFGHLLDEVFTSLADKAAKNGAVAPTPRSIFGPNPFLCGTVTESSDGCIKAKTDAEKLAKFLKDIGAC